jgi:hypothetical protein
MLSSHLLDVTSAADQEVSRQKPITYAFVVILIRALYLTFHNLYYTDQTVLNEVFGSENS